MDSSVNIDFENVSYRIPNGKNNNVKQILHKVNGKFVSGQLTALLGPSGSGKTTLLNVLSGYKVLGVTGQIRINGERRNLNSFLKTSGYIMQDDLVQPMLTVEESMMMVAHLKLGGSKHQGHTLEEKRSKVAQILQTLRMHEAKRSCTTELSGGERKRLSIALELISNPRVLFLDEPTTGLDNVTSFQCIQLLKQIAENGCTVICSIHSPSAKLFALFNRTYVLSEGRCVYQGYGPDIISFLRNLDLICPTSYSPADFIIEICCGEYGDFHELLTTKMRNGRCQYFNANLESIMDDVDCDDASGESSRTSSTFSQRSSATNRSGQQFFDSNVSTLNNSENEKNDGNKDDQRRSTGATWCQQFCLLLKRMWIQMYRNKHYLLLKFVVHIVLGLIVGNIYINIAKDASKMLFNYGFYYNCMIFFMYVPMLPMLLHFPAEVQHVKREHFNRWYCLSAYFCALTVSSLPIQLALGSVYLTILWLLSGQTMEMDRLVTFYAICLLTGIAAETHAIIVASVCNITNSIFLGTVTIAPQLVLCAYGFGEYYSTIPVVVKVLMHLCFLRYSFQGLINTMLRDQPKLFCPDDFELCYFTDPNDFIEVMGMNDRSVTVDVLALLSIVIVMRLVAFKLLQSRLSQMNKNKGKLMAVIRYVRELFQSTIRKH